ncbi:MAG TPA: hypothetical protein DEH78_09525, partial [Solibacterales bacterium]|nr:hypothetical protein [Bryobacterales bacterium]
TGGPTPVGWFRSRRQGDPRPKPEDLSLHYRYFGPSGGFFLVLRPSVFGPTQAAIFLADADGALSDSPAHEFELEAAAAASPAPRPPRAPIAMRDRAHAAAKASPAPPPAPAPVAVPVPAFLSTPEHLPPRRFYWSGTATAILVAALVLSAVFLVALFVRPPFPGLALAVSEEDGRRLRVQWDRAAISGEGPRSGSLEINDGGVTRSVAMNGETLDAGSAIYTRLTDDVQFRLTVRLEGKADVSAEARYLGAGSARRFESDPAKLERQVQELIQERDELKTRVNKLTERAVFAEKQLQKMKEAGR